MAVDQRAQKSRTKIYQALLQLCDQGVAFDQVSVRLLVETAYVSRQTFYRHYASPQAVITQLFDAHLADFLSAFHVQQLQGQPLTAESMVAELLRSWQNRFDFFRLVEWANMRQVFIQGVSRFNASIARDNHKALMDEQAICDIYAASIYMFLRSYVLQRLWTVPQATALLLHLTNNFDQIF